METSDTPVKRKRGQQLVQAERNALITKLVNELSKGYQSSYMLSKKLKVSVETVDRYRTVADELIKRSIRDVGVIRNLEINNTYHWIEEETKKYYGTKNTDTQLKHLDRIIKLKAALANISGLNTEVRVNIDPQQLVIIRAAKDVKNDTSDNKNVIDV